FIFNANLKRNMINSQMKRVNSFVVFLFVLMLYNETFAQQKKMITITGRVTSAHVGTPLSGVSVRVNARPIATASEYNGAYTITFPETVSPTLVFSGKGLQAVEVPVGGEQVVDVEMEKKQFVWDDFQILPDFHLNRFKDQDNGLRGLSEGFFTVANAADPQNVELCEQLGLGVIITEAPHLREKDWLQFSDAEIDQKIKRMVENGGDNDAIIGYYLADEPHVSAFPALGKAVAAVKKYAPGKLA